MLSAFRSTAVVGLFEAVIRPHALVRQLHGTLVVTIVPVASGFIAVGDEERLHDLLLRGTRYVMAAVVPLTVVLMVISAPLLEVWLGPEFREAAPAMAILLSYWLLNGATGVGGAMLVARGRAKELTKVAWLTALLNLGLSVALTPWLGPRRRRDRHRDPVPRRVPDRPAADPARLPGRLRTAHAPGDPAGVRGRPRVAAVAVGAVRLLASPRRPRDRRR